MNLLTAFSVPIWESVLPNFEYQRSGILASVKTLRQQHPHSTAGANIGGWRSPSLIPQDPVMQELFGYVAHMGQKIAFDLQFRASVVGITDAYVTINSTPMAMTWNHTVPDMFTGVVCISAPARSGKIVLANPVASASWIGSGMIDTKNKYNSAQLRIEPQDGKIVIWPSYVTHGVEPNEHDQEQVLVTFNVRMLDAAMAQNMGMSHAHDPGQSHDTPENAKNQ